jgi:branched-chain amino acid transport system ATP-binding protein
MPAYKIARLGMVHVPEGRGIFSSLTVEENMLLSFRQRVPKRNVGTALERAFTSFPVLSERRGQTAGTLSGGQQRILALARVLATPPRLLIVDELSLGLAPAIVDSVYEALVAIRKTGCAVLVVEQQVDRALAIADQAVLLARGRVAWTGPPGDAASAMESVLGGRLLSAAAAEAADGGAEADQLPADDPDGNAQFEDGRSDAAGADAGSTDEAAGQQGMQATGARKEGT